MKFGNYKNKTTELTEEKKFAKVQPKIGKPAVDSNGLKIPDTIVISLNLLVQRLSGSRIALIDYRTGKKVELLDLQLLQKHLKAL